MSGELPPTRTITEFKNKYCEQINRQISENFTGYNRDPNKLAFNAFVPLFEKSILKYTNDFVLVPNTKITIDYNSEFYLPKLFSKMMEIISDIPTNMFEYYFKEYLGLTVDGFEIPTSIPNISLNNIITNDITNDNKIIGFTIIIHPKFFY